MKQLIFKVNLECDSSIEDLDLNTEAILESIPEYIKFKYAGMGNIKLTLSIDDMQINDENEIELAVTLSATETAFIINL